MKTGELAETIEIDDKLEAMQELVGGMIEEYMPWEGETPPSEAAIRDSRFYMGKKFQKPLDLELTPRCIIPIRRYRHDYKRSM